MTHKEIIKALNTKFEKLGWSYGRLANESNLNVSTVYTSLTLGSVPDTIRLTKMADALGVEIIVNNKK